MQDAGFQEKITCVTKLIRTQYKIIKDAKGKRYKRTSEQLYPKPLQPFNKRTEIKYEMNIPTRVN